jgi:hypothetical protein
MLSVAIACDQRQCRKLPKPHFRNSYNEGNLDPSSKARFSRRNERIGSLQANGTSRDSGGMPFHQETIPKTPGMCADNLFPQLEEDACPYREILYMGGCLRQVDTRYNKLTIYY